MANIGTLTASLALQSAAFIRDLGRASQAVASNTAQMRKNLRAVEQSSRGVEKAFNQFKGAALALGAAMAVRQFASFTKQVIDSASALKDVASTVGLTTKALQEYRVAAGLSGVASEKFDKSIQKFVDNIGDARKGTGTLVAAFKDTDKAFLQQIATANSTEKALDLVFQKMSEIPDAAGRASVATAAFGKVGVQLTALVADGASSLAEMRQQAIDLGLVLEDSLIKQAEAAGDRLDLLKGAFETGFNRSIITEFADSFQLTKDNINAAREAGENFGRIVGIAMKAVSEATQFVGEHMRELLAVLAGIVALKAAGYFLGLGAAVVKFAQSLLVAARSAALIDTLLSKSVLGVVAKLALAMGAAALTWELFGEQAMKTADALDEAAKSLEHDVTPGVDALADKVKEATLYLRLQALQNQQLASALRRSKKEYEALARAIEIENDATELGVKFTTEAGKAWKEAAEEAQKFKGELEDLIKAQEEQEREAKRLAEEQQRIMQQPFLNAITGIQGAFTDAFEKIFSGGINSFKDLADAIKGVFVRLAAEIAALLVFRPILASTLGAIGATGLASSLGLGGATAAGAGAGAAAGTAAAGGVGGFSLASLGGGALAALQSQAVGKAFAGWAANAGLSEGAQAVAGNIGLNLGVNMLGGAVGGIGANLLGLGSGNALIDSGLGLAGGILGQIAIPIPGVGAAVGSFLGTALGGLFGKGGAPKAFADTNVGFGATANGFRPIGASGTGVIGSGGEAVDSLAGAFAKGINEIFDAAKLSLSQKISVTFGFQRGLTSAGVGGKDLGLDDNANATLKKTIAEFLKESVHRDIVTGLFPALTSALTAPFDSLQELGDRVSAVLAEREQITALLDPATKSNSIVDVLKAVNDQFDQMALRAADLGLSLDLVNKAREREITNLKLQARAPFLDAAANIVSFVQAQSAQNLSPAAQLTQTQTLFGELLTRARSGDATAAGALVPAADQLLALGRQNFASGASFQGLASFVNSSLLSVADTITSDSFFEAQIEATRQQTTVLADKQDQTIEAIGALRREIQLLGEKLAA